MLSSMFYCLWLQQQSPPPVPEAPAPPAVAPTDATAPPEAMPTQTSARAPGSSLLNPALSFILDTTFGYYGRNAGDFAALGLPVAGDDPSDINEGFGVQEIEIAAQAAIDPYLDGAVFLTIPNLEGIEVEEAYLVTTSLPANLQIKAGTFRTASAGRARSCRCCYHCPGSRPSMARRSASPRPRTRRSSPRSAAAFVPRPVT